MQWRAQDISKGRARWRGEGGGGAYAPLSITFLSISINFASSQLCVWACSLLSSVFLCLGGEGFTLTCLPLYIVYHAFLYQDLGNTLFLFMFQRGNNCVGNYAVSSLVPCLLALLLLVDILTVKGQLAAHSYQQLPVPII